MLLIVYDTFTQNNARFIKKLNLAENETVKITPDLIVSEPFVLLTYTTGFGEVPKTTLNFLEINNSYIQGVAASGNTIWGDNFARSADTISEMYGIPILIKFEMSGMPEDVETFKERVQNIRYETYRVKQRGDTA